jgi:hypothetical protein
MAYALKALIPLMANDIPPNLSPDLTAGLKAIADTVSTWEGPTLDPETLFRSPSAAAAAPTAPPAGDTVLVPPAPVAPPAS